MAQAPTSSSTTYHRQLLMVSLDVSLLQLRAKIFKTPLTSGIIYYYNIKNNILIKICVKRKMFNSTVKQSLEMFFSLVYTSGSRRWKHGGPPKMDLNILAAHQTSFELVLVFQALNCVQSNLLLGCFVMLLSLLMLTFCRSHAICVCNYDLKQNWEKVCRTTCWESLVYTVLQMKL